MENEFDLQLDEKEQNLILKETDHCNNLFESNKNQFDQGNENKDDNANLNEASQDQGIEASQQNSFDDENALVREIKKFMETEEKDSIKLIDNKEENMESIEQELTIVDENYDSVICDFKPSEPTQSNEIIVNGVENDLANHFSKSETKSSEFMGC